MKKIITLWVFLFTLLTVQGLQAQVAYDSLTRVDTNNTSVNTNTNATNVNSNATNTNYNYGTVTNLNDSRSTTSSNSVSDSRNDTTNRSDITQRVISPPPTAIAPAMMSGGNNDLCTTGISGAAQTQILGISAGATVRDLNCERLKLSKTLYDMGMRVAAVSALCQDRRVWDAMMSAGTPCPFDGKIGDEARLAWQQNPERIPVAEVSDKERKQDAIKNFSLGALFGALFAFLL